ncbi:MAG: NusG domain II-containing protein [Lachnospiraceae bacterium]|nr:NusG domain II-containing protein [Lachnospiraceae bacterium]
MKDEERKSTVARKWAAVIIFTLFVTVTAAAIAALQRYAGDPSAGVKYVVVESEGNVLYEVPLTEDDELIVDTDKGVNIIEISDGRVYVKSADCPNQICVNTEPISETGESIVCLPHRMVVSVRLKKPRS